VDTLREIVLSRVIPGTGTDDVANNGLWVAKEMPYEQKPPTS
jgi:hypothetical protein